MPTKQPYLKFASPTESYIHLNIYLNKPCQKNALKHDLSISICLSLGQGPEREEEATQGVYLTRFDFLYTRNITY